MKQNRIKRMFCILGFAVLFLLLGVFLLKGKKFYATPDWMEVMGLQLVDTNYSGEEREQLQKRYEEELVDAALELGDWTGREEEKERYRNELLQE